MNHATIIATGSTHKVAKNEKGWITLFMGDGSTKAFRSKDLIPAEIRTTETPSATEIFAQAAKANALPEAPAKKARTPRTAARTPRARKPISERRNGVIHAEYLPKYQAYKRADGKTSLDNGDGVAATLRGVALELVYKTCAKEIGESVEALKAKYGHLNPGMQRMNLGNRLRAHYRAIV
jgi:hypothetical protein